MKQCPVYKNDGMTSQRIVSSDFETVIYAFHVGQKDHK